jgi:hypothetical protein
VLFFSGVATILLTPLADVVLQNYFISNLSKCAFGKCVGTEPKGTGESK